MEEEIRFMTVDEGMVKVLNAVDEVLKKKQKEWHNVMFVCAEAIQTAIDKAVESASFDEMEEEVNYVRPDQIILLGPKLHQAGWRFVKKDGKLFIQPIPEKKEQYEKLLQDLKKRYEV